MGGRGKQDNIVQSVMRAVDILEALERSKGEFGVSDLSRELGLHKSTVYGILNTLAQRGLVEQVTSTGKYRLGIRLFEMGHRIIEEMDFQSLAAPIMESLVEKYQETCHLVVRNGPDVVYVEKRESARSVRIASKVGTRLPCYCTGVGKALLAEMTDDEVEELYKGKQLKAFTSSTMTDMGLLREELRKIRKQGYAEDYGEFDESVMCVSAVVTNHTGRPVAAISISGPSSRMDEARMREMALAVKEAAERLSRQLGGRG
ncbi:MAG: IclR family transcriptional regulator [Clostridia bacterium]|nr:IclR family transcriptional regulator [Clostridia bacterium]